MNAITLTHSLTSATLRLRRALFVGAALLGLGFGLGACDSKSLGEESCKPGETKEVDCNTCSCQDGQWACTEKACAGYEPCLDKECGDACTVCAPNDPECVETQVLKACNAMGACVSDSPDLLMCEGGGGGECMEGESKMIDCNSCSCIGGYWGCTQIGCGGYDPCAGKACGDACTICDPADPECVETQELKACNSQGVCESGTPGMCEPACMEGEIKMIECNTCSCLDGNWACTQKGCGYDGCSGKVCGETCTICDPADPECVETQEIKVCNLKGVCVSDTGDVCEGYMPCSGKVCGETCTICDPADPDCVEDQVVKACNTESQCVPDTGDLCL